METDIDTYWSLKSHEIFIIYYYNINLYKTRSGNIIMLARGSLNNLKVVS